MCLRFPTWTQVTGSLIPRHGLNIMYDETFPWYLRFEEYGIHDAESVTQRIYDGIFPVVHDSIRYIMLGGDYPWNARFKFQFEMVY